LAEVSASFVVVLAFDRHFESPTLPSLFLCYFCYIVSSPLHSLRWSTRSFTFALRYNNTCRSIGWFLATSVCVTHHDKIGYTAGTLGRTSRPPLINQENDTLEMILRDDMHLVSVQTDSVEKSGGTVVVLLR
jgi:hypothetical protein